MNSADRLLWDEEWHAFVASGEDMLIQETIDEMKLSHLRSIFGVTGNGSALEVGCGTGSLSSRLAALGCRTTCLDFSSPALDLARKRYKRTGQPGEFVLGDAFELPFRSGSFDLVTSTGLLEHFPDPQIIVREMVRVLRSGGVFYSDVWPRKFSLFRAFDVLRRAKHKVTGRQELFEGKFDERAIHGILSGAGLLGVRVVPAGVFPPILPLAFRFRSVVTLHARLLRRWSGFFMSLDGSRAASVLGCYYSAGGIKS